MEQLLIGGMFGIGLGVLVQVGFYVWLDWHVIVEEVRWYRYVRKSLK